VPKFLDFLFNIIKVWQCWDDVKKILVGVKEEEKKLIKVEEEKKEKRTCEQILRAYQSDILSNDKLAALSKLEGIPVAFYWGFLSNVFFLVYVPTLIEKYVEDGKFVYDKREYFVGQLSRKLWIMSGHVDSRVYIIHPDKVNFKSPCNIPDNIGPSLLIHSFVVEPNKKGVAIEIIPLSVIDSTPINKN